MKERKLYAHFIDSSMNGTTASYVRIGDDLEEYNIDLNPSVTQFRNILGESKIRNEGYEPSGSVSPYYYTDDDTLAEAVWGIADGRITGSGCETTVIDVLIDDDDSSMTSCPAYKENVKIVPQSMGGDTSGVQIPFQVYYNGSRVAGTFNLSTKAFTPA